MKILFLFISLLLFSSALAQEFKMDKLTIGSNTYAKVVIKKNADGVSIFHTDGVKRIGYKDLPPDLAKLVGPFDSKKAAEAQNAAKLNEQKNEKITLQPAKSLDGAKLQPAKKLDSAKLQPAKLEPAKGLDSSKGVK